MHVQATVRNLRFDIKGNRESISPLSLFFSSSPPSFFRLCASLVGFRATEFLSPFKQGRTEKAGKGSVNCDPSRGISILFLSIPGSRGSGLTNPRSSPGENSRG